MPCLYPYLASLQLLQEGVSCLSSLGAPVCAYLLQTIALMMLNKDPELDRLTMVGWKQRPQVLCARG